MLFTVERFASPIGTVVLASDGEALRVLHLDDDEERVKASLARTYGEVTICSGRVPVTIRQPLTSYFEGELTALDRIPVQAAGTPFQLKVWAALRGIPVGTTMSYGGLAQQLGMPGASRAVGLANGSNPIGVVVPCHRVIGADGTLTGYGGGLPRKRWLLAHEGVRLRKDNQLALDFIDNGGR
jgi:methylated-DNA-[protein]-cysteine S-methyltransferase